MECKEPVYVRFTYCSSRGLARYNLDLVCVEEVTLDKGGTERVRDYTFFLWKRKRKSSIWNRIFFTPQNNISS
jgi:hypothetical protein